MNKVLFEMKIIDGEREVYTKICLGDKPLEYNEKELIEIFIKPALRSIVERYNEGDKDE